MWVIPIFALWISTTLSKECVPSKTTVSGTHAPPGPICRGQLLFEDNFLYLDLKKWQHEQTLAGGGNWEFQWYTNNRTNSYVDNGTLHIKPTLLADQFGEHFLYSGTLDINGAAPADACTNPTFYGCVRTGTTKNLLNPIKSARIHSIYSFSFKFGKVEVRAKLPAGDWLWPAIWMMPRYNQYSGWPSSGEIDIMESRGNRNLVKTATGENIGVVQMGSTLHWGPSHSNNRYNLTSFQRHNKEGYDKAFHRYQLHWTPQNLTFLVDDSPLKTVTPPQGGFWKLGNLDETGFENPWKRNSKMAPFDQEFYLIINLAVGGTNYFFPEDATNTPGKKPWKNSSPTAMKEFWEGRQQWLPTWDLVGDKSHLQVDYVKVWAL